MGVGRPPVPQRRNLGARLFSLLTIALSRRDKISIAPAFKPGIRKKAFQLKNPVGVQH